ncbi:hypothetical protein EUX98_g4819 [Antrodiella citrinella]|uniref:RNA polymerase II-associated protein 1 N-terminal domain-containing protein n=1 Tax=Antrodiella citrinella TaxID=2447956 RepID=A0A4V3XIJ2_9APHY|nr:hypothetical protein EUX98_g4819 [Antrodiella citrinella]
MSDSLVGSVFERKSGPSVHNSPKFNGSKATGFPAAKHRSQSAFAKARNDTRNIDGLSRLRDIPIVEPLKSPRAGSSSQQDTEGDWRKQAEAENQRKVESMTDEEREQERIEILERFGPNIAEVLRKARQAREGTAEQTEQKDPLSIDTTLKSPGAEKRAIKSALASRPSSPSPASSSSTRPSSRTDRRLRFAELTAQDVHVYESAPPSPRKKALALPPPTPEDGPTVSLGSYNNAAKLHASHNGAGPVASRASEEDRAEYEEGTPEYIRRRFFPAATPRDPSLAWIEADAGSSTGPADSTLRFDLTGVPISPEMSLKLPTHLGLHHHAEGSHAGYTLDDLFLLSRSTVPAQRASMLDVLGRIARRIGKTSRDRGVGIAELKGQEAILRKRILAAGVEAMAERGTLGIRAIEAVWVCVVGWDEDLIAVEDAELQDFSADGALSSIPLDYVLGHVSAALAADALPQKSLRQLLAVVHRLAQESEEAATSVVEAKGLISNMTQVFLLTPYPPEADSPLPEPFAVQVLTTLTRSSRFNALTLLGAADALLRFVITPPPSSPYSQELASSLLSAALRFYSTLASYGLYAGTAATTQEQLHHIRQYVLSEACSSMQLREAWLELLELWMVCARDPHMTTPDHDILWTQVVGWGWAEDILNLRPQLPADRPEAWTMLWRALAAWLEGASVNGVRGGEAEKNAVLDVVRDGFASGVEHTIIETCMGDFKKLLQTGFGGGQVTFIAALADKAAVLAAVIRLWLSCLPSASQQGLDGPPFSLPFPQITQLCGQLITHPLWSAIYSENEASIGHIHLRPLSKLLSAYLGMSRVLPGTTDDIWMAQALSIVLQLLPGDEEVAAKTIGAITELVNPSFMKSRNWPVPDSIWERKGLASILPFLTYTLRKSERQVGPIWTTPYSISTATTQRLPPLSRCRPTAPNDLPLPLSRDWTLSPLDYLLRSGQTDIFKSLPSSWDASEVDIVRASLLLSRVAREVLYMHGLGRYAMSREETVFGCMKVFMLEHGQQQEFAALAEEVFRDSVVANFMNDLLAPFTLAASREAADMSTDGPLLDAVATRFLGSSTPFYQYYTDFVGLYDSISFSHPIFARLLLPPLSMRYPSDYRKYVWADHGHIIRTIKISSEQVLATSLDEYLFPVESNPEVLTGYLRAITKEDAKDFLFLVAVHHIASNIWPDLQDSGSESNDAKAVKLLQAAVGQGFDGVRAIVTYKQDCSQSPVNYFSTQAGEWREERKRFAEKCGVQVRDRIEKLL